MGSAGRGFDAISFIPTATIFRFSAQTPSLISVRISDVSPYCVQLVYQAWEDYAVEYAFINKRKSGGIESEHKRRITLGSGNYESWNFLRVSIV
jgi:hypothetical protein